MADLTELFDNPADAGLEFTNLDTGDPGCDNKVGVQIIPAGPSCAQTLGVHNTSGGLIAAAPAWSMQVYSELTDTYPGGGGVQTYNAVTTTSRAVTNDNNASLLMDGEPMLQAHPGGVSVHCGGVCQVSNNVEVVDIGGRTLELLEVRHRLNGVAANAGFAREFGIVAGLFVSKPVGARSWPFLLTPSDFSHPDADAHGPWFGVQIKVAFDSGPAFSFTARTWIAVVHHGNAPSLNADQSMFA